MKRFLFIAILFVSFALPGADMTVTNTAPANGDRTPQLEIKTTKALSDLQKALIGIGTNILQASISGVVTTVTNVLNLGTVTNIINPVNLNSTNIIGVTKSGAWDVTSESITNELQAIKATNTIIAADVALIKAAINSQPTNIVRGLAFVSDPIPLLVDGTATAYAAGDLWADIITVTNVFSYTNNSKAIITGIKLLINQDSAPAVTLIPMSRAWTMGATNSANATSSSEMNYGGLPIKFTSSDYYDCNTNRIGFKTGLSIQVTSTNRNLLFLSIADDTTAMSNQLSTITVFGYIDQDPAE